MRTLGWALIGAVTIKSIFTVLLGVTPVDWIIWMHVVVLAIGIIFVLMGWHDEYPQNRSEDFKEDQ